MCIIIFQDKVFKLQYIHSQNIYSPVLSRTERKKGNLRACRVTVSRIALIAVTFL